jgi:hypothetical protein
VGAADICLEDVEYVENAVAEQYITITKLCFCE